MTDENALEIKIDQLEKRLAKAMKKIDKLTANLNGFADVLMSNEDTQGDPVELEEWRQLDPNTGYA